MRRLLIFICSGLMTNTAEAFVGDMNNHEDLQKKCLVELKYNFVPSNCFRWLKTDAISAAKKVYLQEWFSGVCKKAVQKDESQVQFHVHNIAMVSKECQKHLESAFEQWSYKSKSEEPEKIMQLMTKSLQKIGRDIEYNAAHDMEKAKRHRNHRSARRGIN